MSMYIKHIILGDEIIVLQSPNDSIILARESGAISRMLLALAGAASTGKDMRVSRYVHVMLLTNMLLKLFTS